jgi:hypothetical protein
MRTFFFLFAFVSISVFAHSVPYTLFTVDSLPISCMEKETCRLVIHRTKQNVITIVHHNNDTCSKLNDFVLDESRLPFESDYFILEKNTYTGLTPKAATTWKCLGGVRSTH